MSNGIGVAALLHHLFSFAGSEDGCNIYAFAEAYQYVQLEPGLLRTIFGGSVLAREPYPRTAVLRSGTSQDPEPEIKFWILFSISALPGPHPSIFKGVQFWLFQRDPD
jgi:hypothetical protein